ncbi:dimethylsulfoxide reductase subunit B [Bacillus sp. HMF5848]|uniref:DMSO/selenate family reductase complex B subunit n=1 Tax=Bacillus sp. HMF5848 TaxID=2495421 RepID=UPI000F7B67D4|nr:DMSO/selenate family reductase complex B subunit [Bacillus sp. HMF5848]RSK23937.1 dimethylsulfoxide reductase subunit B [Bacillus sp. HMF5848]RSK28753.1 dimethylsulfoxide reductase subunit B [Bacillus sp. HMF5848]
MGQKGFYYNSVICTGCKGCQIACKDKNDLKVGVLFRRVYSFEGGRYPKTWGYYLSLSCNHCAEPKCAQNCPTGAIYKRESDGLVVQDREKCIGCKTCIWSCPYEGPQYIEEERKVGKCDGCADLVDEGQNPVCVDSCPMRAIEFGEIAELRKKYGDNANLKVLVDAGITKPSITVHAKEQAKY